MSKGADVDAVDVNGSTALIHSSLNGYMEMTNLLVESGADVNRKNYYFDTPLSVAVMHGRIEAAEYLIENKASLKDAFFRITMIGAKGAEAFLISKGADPKDAATQAIE